MASLEITDVNGSNVDQLGFFCAMSMPASEGYRRKLHWLKQRFPEGLKLKIITSGGRGFIEYVPGTYAWRGIQADDYMVIHCMWVVGRSKACGCGKALLAECIRDARAGGMAGVAVVSARGQLGLPPTSYFQKQAFEVVDTASPDLQLAVLKFRKAADPEFLGGWERKLRRLGTDLAVVCSPQCPYSESYVANVAMLSKKCGMSVNVVRLETLKQIREKSPSAYGSAAIVANRNVRLHLYHHLTEARLRKLTGPGL